MIISLSVLLTMRNVSEKRNCRENQNTHFMFSSFFSENHAVNGIIWRNMIERGRPQMTRWSMRVSRWVAKAKNTH